MYKQLGLVLNKQILPLEEEGESALVQASPLASHKVRDGAMISHLFLSHLSPPASY